MRPVTSGMVACRNKRIRSEGRVVRAYRVRAALALGRSLTKTQDVHHHSPTQIVICQDHKYHGLLHIRTRVLRAGGRPDTDRICSRCQHVMPIDRFSPNRVGLEGRNQMCRACERLRKRVAYLKVAVDRSIIEVRG